MKIIAACLVLNFTFFSLPLWANDYYVDNLSGNDSNQGNTTTTPWKTLQKVNNVVFKSGDRIYLKRGQIYNGYLHLKTATTSRNGVYIGAYGTGRRPLVNATGHSSGFVILDAGNVQIHDLEINGSNSSGIFIGCTRDGLTLEHILINNCVVQNIGDTSKPDWETSRSNGGIIVVNGNLDKDGKPLFYNSVFNDVTISNCTVRYNNRWTSISISSGKINNLRGNRNYIRNCIAEYSAADGIRMNGVRNSVIEYSVMYRNGAWPNFPGRNLGGLGAWFFDADNCTIQYCEAGYVQASETDGGAFDIDYLQTNSTVQYSYGHHCSGYGVSVFGADSANPTVNSVVRYNIFNNNGRDSAFAFQGDFYVFTWGGGYLNGVNIHHNISFWDPVASAPSLKFKADFTGNLPNTFTNNIIYSRNPWLASFKSDSLKSDSNRYWFTSGRPLWELKEKAFHILEDWQKNSRLDQHSRYTADSIDFPGWYVAGNKSALRLRTAVKQLKRGDKAPELIGSTFNNTSVDLSNYHGSPVLLAFLSINTGKNTHARQAMESQLVFIKSMKRQYEGKGLKIIVVETSALTSGQQVSKETLGNFIADHDEIGMIIDSRDLNIASRFGVQKSPSTFLISGEGTIAHTWQNLVLPATLAFAIEAAFKE